MKISFLTRIFSCTVFFLIGSSLLVPAAGSKEPAKEGNYIFSVSPFKDDAKHTAQRLREGDAAACLFKTEMPLVGIALRAPSYSNNIGDLTLTVYHWKGSLEKTFAEKPLASETYVDFHDNALLRLRVRLWPGRYLWVADGSREQVGLWKSPEMPDNARAFWNGELLSDGCWQFSFLGQTEIPFSGTLDEYNMFVSLPRTSPPEPESPPALAQKDVMPDTWDAVDELGRELPGASETGAPRSGKQVGIFYWTWHEMARTRSPNYGPWDVTKITAEHPEAVGDLNHPAWGPLFSPHFWGEPVLGYYTTCDPWVLRKHADLLADAGVDVAIFDATNGTMTWMDSVLPLFEVWSKARAEGVRTPKTAFMLPFFNLDYVADSLRQLYRDIYKPGVHPEMWYYWNGKPLIYADPDALKRLLPKVSGEEKQELEEILGFFTFRPGQPSYTGGPRRCDQWSWLEVYPQHGYVERLDGSFEMVTVGVAQNHTLNPLQGKPGLHAMNDRDVFGRGYRVGEERPADPDAFVAGGNFSQQWSRAFEIDPDFVFVTGWNEWVAGRHDIWQELPNAFPDQYNEEFSRDCEPERGKLMDTFYMQLVANIRKFKGTRRLPAPSAAKTIDLAGDWTQWQDVRPEYRDYPGDTLHRDFDGYGGVHYTNETGRNDIVLCKVARDSETVYFYVETAEKLSGYSSPNWMRLLIGIPQKTKSPNWKGFSYLVEQTKEKAVLKEYAGKNGEWQWREIGEVPRSARGRRLAVAVPREMILPAGKKVDIRFKWSDNMQAEGDVLDFYENGDTAPDGRFAYRYKE
ncbi:MAG: hypothetical protein IJG60_00790 [Thermoguttaceae bacterium]|nr:hypothetical protein [Thermoguttaceae bacterium]